MPWFPANHPPAPVPEKVPGPNHPCPENRHEAGREGTGAPASGRGGVSGGLTEGEAAVREHDGGFTWYWQNRLMEDHIEMIVDTYRERPESVERYARRVDMDEIETNGFNLNISRYVSTAEPEVEIDLSATHGELAEIEKRIRVSTAKHNEFLKELGLSPLAMVES